MLFEGETDRISSFHPLLSQAIFYLVIQTAAGIMYQWGRPVYAPAQYCHYSNVLFKHHDIAYLDSA